MTARARRRAACLLVLCALCLPWPAAVAEDTPAPEEGAALQGAETPLPEEGATGTARRRLCRKSRRRSRPWSRRC